MRELSTRMIEAVLDGEGLQGVAELAAAEAGGTVAIVLPPRGLAGSGRGRPGVRQRRNVLAQVPSQTT